MTWLAPSLTRNRSCQFARKSAGSLQERSFLSTTKRDGGLQGNVGSMMFWIGSAVGLLVAYLLGSTPTGYLAGKLVRGIDIREHGSKSTGATNVLRTLGKWPALFVLVADVLKGVAAIVFAQWCYPWLLTRYFVVWPKELEIPSLVPWLVCLSGLAVLLGHGRSIWLQFTGGNPQPRDSVFCWRFRCQWE